MAGRYYKPELDALRFFAFLCVFCNHQRATTPWIQSIEDTGEFGMCIFFMLSAYLIVTLLLREKEASGTINLRRFAVRRILRIWPLYFAALTLTCVLGHYWASAYISRHAVVAFSLLLGNVYILVHGWIGGPITPLWSLSVEEQFYLVVPLATRLAGRRALRFVCVGTILVSYATLLWLGHRGAAPILGVWVNSFVQFQFFAAGGLLAMMFCGRSFAPRLRSRCAMALIGIAFWSIASVHFHLRSWFHSTPQQLFFGYLLVLAGTLLIFLSVLDIDRPIPEPFLYLGKISYGLYIFHELFIWLLFDTTDTWPWMKFFSNHKLVAIPVIFALTVAAASISYHFFERPILRFKQRFEAIRTRPV